jgi:hypothetical protein
MRVRSGAGSFYINIDRVSTDEGDVVLLGTVDEWDARTLMTPGEFVRLGLLSLHPSVLFLLLRAGLKSLRPGWTRRS